MTAWIVFGDPCHTASPNEEQGLVWHVRWISDVSSYIALFWIGTITSCTFSVLKISDLWCFAGAAVVGLYSPQHSTTQFNQLIKCNVWQCTAQLLQSTLSRPYSFVLKFWTRSSWVIWFAINEYCCLSKPLFHWIHSQSILRYFCWKWKWKVRSGSRSKTGIFPGLFVLSTNVWTGGYLVFKSF